MPGRTGRDRNRQPPTRVRCGATGGVAGAVEYGANATVFLTERGRALARRLDVPQTSHELHEQLFRKLGAGRARILRALIDAYPSETSLAMNCPRLRGIAPTVATLPTLSARCAPWVWSTTAPPGALSPCQSSSSAHDRSHPCPDRRRRRRCAGSCSDPHASLARRSRCGGWRFAAGC